MKIYLVRHTSVAIDEGVCYGSTDLPLAQSADRDIAAVLQKLPATSSTVYSSPLKRCLQLAESISSPVHCDERLQEYNFGDWEMMRWDEIQGTTAAHWFEDYVNIPAPNGESYAQMAKRVLAFWQQALKPSQDNHKIILVTHAGVIRIVLAHCLQLPLAQAFNFTLALGSVSALTFHNSHMQIEFINR